MIYGFVLTIPILFLAKDRVSNKALVVFILNNWSGPDSFWVYSFLPFPGHSVLGFPVWALLLAFFYTYFSRFSFSLSKKGLTITDDGVPELSYRDSYLLVVAGGLSHFFIDMLGHTDLDLNLWPSINLKIEQLHLWGATYYHTYTAWIILGFAIIIFVCLTSLSILKLEIKDILVIITVIIATVVVTSFYPGGVVWGELELSMMVIVVIYFFIPLTLLGYSLRNISNNPIKTYKSRFTVNQKIQLLYFINIILGVLITAASLFALAEYQLLGEAFGFNGEYIRTIASIVVFAGAFILILSVLLPITKKNIVRRILMNIYVPMFPLIFPFAIYLLFNEKEIIEMFHKSKI